MMSDEEDSYGVSWKGFNNQQYEICRRHGQGLGYKVTIALLEHNML